MWFGAPLVLAACVAAEAAPQTYGSPEREPAQIRLGKLVRDGVARLAESTRQAIAPSHATFVLMALDRLSGGSVHCPMTLIERPESVRASFADLRAYLLDPGRSSSPTAAP